MTKNVILTMLKAMDEEYVGWKALKYQLINKRTKPPKFNERDIWWCSVGVNVGYEINGKHDLKERCVLVIKKFNNDMFFGLPLTTQQKDYDSRFITQVKDKSADIILDQAKTFSANRLNRRAKVMGYKEFDNVKAQLIKILELDKITTPSR